MHVHLFPYKDWLTPFMVAVKAGHVEVVKMFLQEPNQQCDLGLHEKVGLSKSGTVRGPLYIIDAFGTTYQCIILTKGGGALISGVVCSCLCTAVRGVLTLGCSLRIRGLLCTVVSLCFTYTLYVL